MSLDLDPLVARFVEVFGRQPAWVSRAPGRVNLIGEHIDYNGGWVMPAAINREIVMLAAPSPTNALQLHSETFNQFIEWSANGLPKGPVSQGWPNYFLAVVEQLGLMGLHPPQLLVLIAGDIPPGAGLSSSAAFEVCAVRLLLASIGQELPGNQVALIAQAAEHSRWVGVRCGIMDQFISANAVKNHALVLNCGELNAWFAPLDPSLAAILIIHSTVPRELVKSAYNERREECESALSKLNQAVGAVHPYLVDFTLEQLSRHKSALSEVEFRRARHVLAEQARVEDCMGCLERGRMDRVGELLNASHASLRDDYEVSCPELDSIHEIAKEIPGVYGCRMTGAGFGGCAVALVSPDGADSIAAQIAVRFERKWEKRPWALRSPACAGAGAVTLI
ncbi:MAG: galactokinase [Candidatus Omnitrophica bacterium]|nr:Galactokinase [bacterium]NUN96433.1 galactokinase [Candidatus Omnitrophota bacterium]